jgi:hypothetical protein
LTKTALCSIKGFRVVSNTPDSVWVVESQIHGDGAKIGRLVQGRTAEVSLGLERFERDL